MGVSLGAARAARKQVGTPVEVVASPYALLCPQVLANLVSAGIISTVVPDPGTRHVPPLLYMTDCRCQPGSEGAVVVRRLRHELVGVRPRHGGADAT